MRNYIRTTMECEIDKTFIAVRPLQRKLKGIWRLKIQHFSAQVLNTSNLQVHHVNICSIHAKIYVLYCLNSVKTLYIISISKTIAVMKKYNLHNFTFFAPLKNTSLKESRIST